MCSFGSCKTRSEFLSQFRKVRNAFECFVTQVQTRLLKTKRVWPMKINVICTVCEMIGHYKWKSCTGTVPGSIKFPIGDSEVSGSPCLRGLRETTGFRLIGTDNTTTTLIGSTEIRTGRAVW